MNALEHINLTVSDPNRTAALLADLFGWHTRWEGPAIDDGYTVHVGTDAQYVALYTPPSKTLAASNSYTRSGGLNHLGVQVDDLDATEARVKAAGYATFNHGDYAPGRRFYFRDHDNVEFEIVSYAGDGAAS